MVFDVDISVGRFMLHINVDGSPGATVEAEFTLMNTLTEAGFPVARPRWSEPTGAVLGQPFFVADHVDAQGFVDDPTAPTAVACVQTLARLHNLKPDAHLPPVRRPRHLRRRSSWRNVGNGRRPGIPLLTPRVWHTTRSVAEASVAGSRPTRPRNVWSPTDRSQQ
jgi:hypothetical protein